MTKGVIALKITALYRKQGHYGLKEGASSNDGIWHLNSPGD